MTTTAQKTSSASRDGRQFVGTIVAVDKAPRKVALARIVTTGPAASIDRRDIALSRAVLVAALDALGRSAVSAAILVTPAGLVDHKGVGKWSSTSGWRTTQVDFDWVADIATDVVGELVTRDVRKLAEGNVRHLIVGIDVWPTAEKEPHAEIACVVDITTGEVIAITGKTYPTSEQEGDLIRNPDVASHVVRIGNERVAVLVCHDLAAWSPRANAVAKGQRAEAWRAMQAGVAAELPTLAVHLPHTLSTAATWRAAWSRLADRAGGQYRSGAAAIRHLDKDWHVVAGRPEDLLAGTARGEASIAVKVTVAKHRRGSARKR